MQDVGYDVITDQVTFDTQPITDPQNISANLKSINGVLAVTFNPAHTNVTIKIIPGAVTLHTLRTARTDAGANLIETETAWPKPNRSP